MGESGDKGLSHVKVDRRAGVADGSTSFYFRTRSALLRAVAERLTERNHEILLSLVDQLRSRDDGPGRPAPSALARRLAATTDEPFRTQARARYEFFMLSTRDPELAGLFQRNIDLELDVLRDFVVRQQQRGGIEANRAVIADQTLAVLVLIGGMTLALIAGDPSFADPEKIDRFLAAAITGIRMVHRPETAPQGDSDVTTGEQSPEPPTSHQRALLGGLTVAPDPLDRRRKLCDTGIQILGESGLKGLSHLKIDRRAGVPDGTTSVHFRTSSALLRALAERLDERARDGLLDVIEREHADKATTGQGKKSSLLATELARAAIEPFRTEVKARYEILMRASRDAEMAASIRFNDDLGFELLREFVLQMQPAGSAIDANAVHDETLAITTLMSGITLTLAAGDPAFRDPERIDWFFSATLAGMRALHKAGITPPLSK